MIIKTSSFGTKLDQTESHWIKSSSDNVKLVQIRQTWTKMYLQNKLSRVWLSKTCESDFSRFKSLGKYLD